MLRSAARSVKRNVPFQTWRIDCCKGQKPGPGTPVTKKMLCGCSRRRILSPAGEGEVYSLPPRSPEKAKPAPRMAIVEVKAAPDEVLDVPSYEKLPSPPDNRQSAEAGPPTNSARSSTPRHGAHPDQLISAVKPHAALQSTVPEPHAWGPARCTPSRSFPPQQQLQHTSSPPHKRTISVSPASLPAHSVFSSIPACTVQSRHSVSQPGQTGADEAGTGMDLPPANTTARQGVTPRGFGGTPAVVAAGTTLQLESAEHLETKQPCSLSSNVRRVFDDRRSLLPLDNPDTLLQDVAAVLGVNDQLHILAALLALRRAALHHEALLKDCLEDVVLLLLDCMQSSDGAVTRAAILVTQDLVLTFGDSVLPYIHDKQDDAQCMVLQLLVKSTATDQGKGIASSANQLLRLIAGELHQPTVIKLLEPHAGTWEYPRLRAKASELLMIATYRL